MLWKWCTQYASKFGKLSSGHRTGRDQFSFQSQRKAIPEGSNYFTIALISHTSREKEMASHPNILAWRIPGTEEPGGLPSVGSHRVGLVWSNLEAAATHASKVMLKILQARLQHYVNCELPDVQAGFRKGRRTRDQIANICGIIKKQES